MLSATIWAEVRNNCQHRGIAENRDFFQFADLCTSGAHPGQADLPGSGAQPPAPAQVFRGGHQVRGEGA